MLRPPAGAAPATAARGRAPLPPARALPDASPSGRSLSPDRRAKAAAAAAAAAAATAATRPRTRVASMLTPTAGDVSARQLLDEVIHHVALPPQQLVAIADSMAAQMQAGLDGAPGATLLMIPTAVDVLPDGHEAGDAYALELGGASLKLLHAALGPRRHAVAACETEEAAVPGHLKVGPVDALFDWVAAKLTAFVARTGWDVAARGPPPLGFCFSFPMRSNGPASGTLLRWAKGYACPGGVGADPAALLAAATRRAGSPGLSVTALANDAVAALAAARYTGAGDGADAVAAIVMHRGTNAAYVDTLARVGKFVCEAWTPRTPDVVVDVEWPGFDDALLPGLPDDAAALAAAGAFESMTGPLYLGDTLAALLARLATRGGAPFGGTPPPALRAPGAFDAGAVCRMAADVTADLRHVAEEVSDGLGVAPASLPLTDRALIRDAAAALLRRSARLTAAGVAGVLTHIAAARAGGGPPPAAAAIGCHAFDGEAAPPPAPAPDAATAERLVIAADGMMLRRGGRFGDELRQALDDCLGAAAAARVTLAVPAGGPPLGVAALAAAAAQRAAVMGTADITGGADVRFPPRRAGTTGAPRAGMF